MKKEVYLYIKNHSHANIHQIAPALGISENEVLKNINFLSSNGYVKMDNPVPLSIENDESCYYTATDKEFSTTNSDLWG